MRVPRVASGARLPSCVWNTRKDSPPGGVWAGMSPWLSDRLLSSQSDERLAALACAGSERAFAAIVQRYRRPLLAFARRLAADADAEDLVQQVFMSALAAMRSGVEVRHLRGWLHQILRHTAVRAARSAELPGKAAQVEPATESAERTAELRLLALEALAAVSALPSRQHEALVATALQGRSRAEVAQLLGLSEGAVRQLIHRARETLRAAVTAITPYPVARTLAAGPPGGGLADVVAGAGAGSAGAVAVKIGALVASGVVATGAISAGFGDSSHRAHHAHHFAASRGARISAAPAHSLAHTPIAEAGHGGHSLAGHATAGDGDSGRSGRSPGGPGTGSSDGGGGSDMDSGQGGPSATLASSTDGGGSGSSDGGMTTATSGTGGGSGSSDGGQTTTTATTTSTTTTTTTSGSSDGGSSGGSGSGDTVTTATTTVN
jgi:RNA polymerase sigma factor (sigma-70 family)